MRDFWMESGTRMAAGRLAVLGLCAAGLAACGSGGVDSTPVSLALVSTGAVASSAQSSTTAVQSAATGPAPVALTPAFSMTIHDYVISCAAAQSIQVNVNLPSGVALGFIDAKGVATPTQTYPGGTFQTTIPMLPGQRFQFSLSNQPENYSVRCIPADFPALKAYQGSTDPSTGFVSSVEVEKPEAQWYVFAPSLQFDPNAPTPSSYVIIADANGTPVWWEHEPLGGAIDAKILAPGQITWTVAGQGQYVIRDFAGHILNVISGELDLHELQLTPTGTYLAIHTVLRNCPPDCADMSPWGGSPQTAVLDAEILELDSHSNVLWMWRTRDHIALAETGETAWFPSVGNDIIHMNAVEPDGTDGVIFSARHLNAIYHITKSTGAIDWKIGGTPLTESLTVTGDTRPTALGPGGQSLSGQHDVRKWPDSTVSVHDDGTIANRPPFVVRYQINTSSRTAQVVEEFTDPRVTFSGCCGSARRLLNGHWVVDWGANALLTEFDSNHLPALTIENLVGGVFSYRAVPVEPGLLSADVLRTGMDVMAAAP